MMEYRQFGDTYVLRLDRGEEVIRSLAAFCKKENVRLGMIEGLGASDYAVVGLYNVEEKQYHKQIFDGAMEITSLVGNISEKDGENYLHCHINLCREDMTVVGGHLNECRISATCELFVRKLDGVVERRLDADGTGLNLYQFL